jgi:hypothetical protein
MEAGACSPTDVAPHGNSRAPVATCRTHATRRPHHRFQQSATAILVLKRLDHVADRRDPRRNFANAAGHGRLPDATGVIIAESPQKYKACCLWLIKASYAKQQRLRTSPPTVRCWPLVRCVPLLAQATELAQTWNDSITACRG